MCLHSNHNITFTCSGRNAITHLNTWRFLNPNGTLTKLSQNRDPRCYKHGGDQVMLRACLCPIGPTLSETNENFEKSARLKHLCVINSRPSSMARSLPGPESCWKPLLENRLYTLLPVTVLLIFLTQQETFKCWIFFKIHISEKVDFLFL